MKSRKIQRLEFVSDKIEGRDCKREVMCIRFGHPTKKNELVWGSPWEAAMAGVHGELVREGKEGGRGRGRGGAQLEALGRQGCCGVGRQTCSLTATAALCSLAAVAARVRRNVHVRKKRRRKERRKRKGGKRVERKKKKYGNFSKLENFRGQK
jgi:hypothetical protein